MTASIHTRSSSWTFVPRPGRVHLSIPGLQDPEVGSLQAKDLLASGSARAPGKYTTAQHLERLRVSGSLDSTRPLFVCGLRNVLVNPRCVAFVRGEVHSVPPELPAVSQRPYYGIEWDGQGRVSARVREFAGELVDDGTQFIAGVPILWPELDDEHLDGLALIEASDHSHLFHLPRGNHPRATDATRESWSRLHEVFLVHVHATAAVAGAAMRRVLEHEPGELREETGYLHQIVGFCADGLWFVTEHGSFRQLRRRLRAKGMTHALVVENSGSVQPSFFPRGLQGDEVCLARAPNHRPAGRALLAVELVSGVSEWLPE